MLLGDYLNNLASKAGISSDDADLKKVLSSPTISGAEIPDSLAAKFDTSLMTLEAAKNNPSVLNAAKAQAYNGMDAEVSRALNDLGVDDTLKAELEAEKNTNKKVSLALKKIAELERAKAGAGKGDKAELDKEISRLNGVLKDIKKAHEDKIASIQAEHESALMNYDLKSQLSGYNFAFPKEMDKGIINDTVMNIINKTLKEKDGKLIRENGALKLVRASTNSAFFNDKNEAVDVKTFIDATLAQNKLLAVNTPAAVPTTTTTPAATTAPINNRNFNALVEKSLADLNAGSTEVVQ